MIHFLKRVGSSNPKGNQTESVQKLKRRKSGCSMAQEWRLHSSTRAARSPDSCVFRREVKAGVAGFARHFCFSGFHQK